MALRRHFFRLWELSLFKPRSGNFGLNERNEESTGIIENKQIQTEIN